MMRRFGIFLAGAMVVGALVLGALSFAPLYAQEPGTYTVQPGDSLSGIAAAYGVSLEALVAANGIADASLIYSGQVLVIPDAATASAGASGGASTVFNPGVPVAVVRARVGETIGAVAGRFGQDAGVVAGLNGVAATQKLFPGQPVNLPQAANTQEEVRFGSITAINVPNAIAQGQTGRVVIESTRPLTITAIWNGLQLPLAPQDAMTRMVALLPAPALIDPAEYALSIAYTTRSGLRVERTLAIPIVDGGYANQVIAFDAATGALLEPTLVQSELEKVRLVTQSFTADMIQRVPFARPIGVEYATTSAFGTRRYYDSNVNSMAGYHAGQDFGAGTGVPILAPSAGIVALAETLQVRGNAVILDHGRGVYTGYWHMSEIHVTPGQMVLQNTEAVLIEALPADIPATIEVDLANLDAENPIKIADLPEMKGITYLTDPEEHLFALTAAQSGVIEETEEEGEGAEPELVTDEDEEEAAE